MRQPDESLLPVIDTVRMTLDGKPVYVTYAEASANLLGICFLWALDHPSETMRGLAWTAALGAAAIMGYDTFRPRRHRR